MAIRKAPARKPARKPAKKTYIKRARPMSMTRDGQSLLVNAYAEIQKARDAANEEYLAYVINIDPKNAVISLANGATAHNGVGDQALPNNTLSYSKYNTFAGLFNQYRVNSATIKVRVDTNSGLEHQVIICNDKGNASAVENMASAVSGAHKSFSMTTSRRECTYTIKTSGQERDFLSTDAGSTQIDGEKKYIKVFQKIPAGAGVAEHQVSMLLSLTLKDSKNLN